MRSLLAGLLLLLSAPAAAQVQSIGAFSPDYRFGFEAITSDPCHDMRDGHLGQLCSASFTMSYTAWLGCSINPQVGNGVGSTSTLVTVEPTFPVHRVGAFVNPGSQLSGVQVEIVAYDEYGVEIGRHVQDAFSCTWGILAIESQTTPIHSLTITSIGTASGRLALDELSFTIWPGVDPDLDGDGSPFSEDCADLMPERAPGFPEVCDGLDNDCDTQVPPDEVDADGDGNFACEECDDNDPSRTIDDVDQDGTTSCDGDCDDFAAFFNIDDADGDGQTTCDGDCDDTDPVLHALDLDGDLETSCDGDCDDADPLLNTTIDVDGDGAHSCEDCDDTDPALTPFDGDGDGFSTCTGDCNDASLLQRPGLDERCNGLDDDCDGTLRTDELDADGDGLILCDGDCDDTDPTRGEGFEEVCDGVDNDCDGEIGDEELDRDGDGVLACDDCDDSHAGVHPGATEVPGDGLDNDCIDGDAPAPTRKKPPEPSGCGCTSAPAPVPAWLLLMAPLLLVRRR